MTKVKTWAVRGCVLTFAGAILVAAPHASVFSAQQPGDQTKAATKGKKPKTTEGQSAVSQAALAAQLALEGEKRHSAVMMLAAAEILGELKESAKPTTAVKAEKAPAKAAQGGKKAPSLDVGDLIDKAREFAKDDPALKALVERRATSRGLIFSQGQNRPSVVIRGTSFKIMDKDVLPPGDTVTYRGLTFEAGKPAIVFVSGDGDGDLDLWVSDSATGSPIGQDTDGTSQCVVEWLPLGQEAVTVQVRNVGRVAEEYFVLTNW